MRRHTPLLLAAVAALAVSVAACGADAPPSDAQPGDNDTPTQAPVDEDETPDEEPSWDNATTNEARQQARGLLGMNEADLPEDVRIARRGSEQFMLTEDYVLGRRTVELDDDGSGYRVMAVTVELPDGPETFELQGG